MHLTKISASLRFALIFAGDLQRPVEKLAGDKVMAFKIGESVVVKSGVVDPDFGTDIGGWQGRVKEVDDDTVFIRWDSITLREMGMDLVIRCENENLDWKVMMLSQWEVERTSSRDSERDVEAVAVALIEEMFDDPRLDTGGDS